MSDVDKLKKVAGVAACNFVRSGMKIGLGTGSTVYYTLIELGRRVLEEGLEIKGVPTSTDTQKIAREVGIPLIELYDAGQLDLVIDGTDEFDSDFQLIKGGGAALLREKIVAQQSNSMIVVADERKRVNTLGKFPLPIEITPFSHNVTIRNISEMMNCKVTLRRKNEKLLYTDNGNLIADVHAGPTLKKPELLEKKLLQIAGVVQVGLFINMCDIVILATENGVETIHNPNGRLK